jgi:DNA primase small subunit
MDEAELDCSSPEVMKLFYSRLFPWKTLFSWLNHDHGTSTLSPPFSSSGPPHAHTRLLLLGLVRSDATVPTRQWTHREFAFTLQGDIYLRYNSFNNADEMKKEVVRLNPSRFEIGAIYSARVRLLPSFLGSRIAFSMIDCMN